MTKLPNSFGDVKQVLDAALTAGGGRYRLPSKGKATHWRQRAYTLRKVLGDLDLKRKGDLPGAVPTTPYDMMWLGIDPLDPCVVTITIGQPSGVLTDLSGAPISLSPGEEKVVVDDLELAASALLEKLGR